MNLIPDELKAQNWKYLIIYFLAFTTFQQGNNQIKLSKCMAESSNNPI